MKSTGGFKTATKTRLGKSALSGRAVKKVKSLKTLSSRISKDAALNAIKTRPVNKIREGIETMPDSTIREGSVPQKRGDILDSAWGANLNGSAASRNSQHSLGGGRFPSGGYNTTNKSMDEYQQEAAEGMWFLAKVAVGGALGAAGAISLAPEAAVISMIWNTATNSIDAVSGDYDPAGHVVGAAANIVGMLPVPGAGAAAVAISAGYPFLASVTNEGDGEGGSQDDGGMSQEDEHGEDGSSNDNGEDGGSNDNGDGDDDNEMCVEEGENSEGEGDSAGDSGGSSNDEQGGGTDNPMDDGPGSPYVLHEKGWGLAEYDGDGRSNTTVSSRNRAGNWGESSSSGSYAKPGTRQDYDVLTGAKGGAVDPGESDLWGPASFYVDMHSLQNVLFQSDGGGTKGPSLLSQDQIVSFRASEGSTAGRVSGLLDVPVGVTSLGAVGGANNGTSYGSLTNNLAFASSVLESQMLNVI